MAFTAAGTNPFTVLAGNDDEESISAGSSPTLGAGQVPRPLDLRLRPVLSKRLREVGFIGHQHPLFMHGRGYEGSVREARCTWKSEEPPRDDHSAPSWLKASEFEDLPEVQAAKCAQLAVLMRMSKKTVAYTGAGISASVVGQAARSGQNTVGWKGDTRCAEPTFTHYALGFLGQRGLIHSWVQQNHDGLPQKAGFPQERINEIHGSWFDPSNPVVKYNGHLHERAFPWMKHDAETADLVLVLGTSLGGLTADQVATSTAKRSLARGKRGKRDRLGGALGTVCMNLQQTEQDGKMTLRFFGKSDDLLKLLLTELDFGHVRFGAPTWPRESHAWVPYDADGRRLPNKSDRPWMLLDLSESQKIRITSGHNIQGARQPYYMHIGAEKPVTYNGATREPGVGLGSVVRRDDASSSFVLNIEGVTMRLGIWWLESAKRGGVEALPVVNVKPLFRSEREAD
jgi:NAD-dependent SIR2 family protein deacetylase